MDDCVFCKIIRGDIPSNIIYDGELVIVIRDLNPQAPHHYLVIPKEHIPNTTSIADGSGEMLEEIFRAIKEVASKKGIDKTGFRTVINQGKYGGQEVDHLHLHLLGGRPMGWPPG